MNVVASKAVWGEGDVAYCAKGNRSRVKKCKNMLSTKITSIHLCKGGGLRCPLITHHAPREEVRHTGNYTKIHSFARTWLLLMHRNQSLINNVLVTCQAFQLLSDQASHQASTVMIQERLSSLAIADFSQSLLSIKSSSMLECYVRCSNHRFTI